ncbi:hypothetical protein [Halorhabdus sp. CBA1104]|uniref:hypothetical protein n=1 Tax=Halorhabdus sp. CBA1104 TaxID=1380432 RepID=UPI0012B2290D|nr:hypothetical protein [Halorhabdus sp. CBA1104]
MSSAYRVRVQALAERARRARGSFLPPTEPPDRDRARDYLRDGVGPAVALYQEATMGAHEPPLSADVSRALERTLAEWLELYAACYGVYTNVDISVAEAVEVRAETESLRELAVRLTGVPDPTVEAMQDHSGVVVGDNGRSDCQ